MTIYTLDGKLLRLGPTVEIPLEVVFPTVSPEQLAELKRPLPTTAPLYVTAINYEQKTVTLSNEPPINRHEFGDEPCVCLVGHFNKEGNRLPQCRVCIICHQYINLWNIDSPCRP